MNSNIYVERGTYFEQEISYNGLNFTGYTYTGRIKKLYTDTLAVNFTIIIKPLDNTKLILSLSNSDTLPLTPNKYQYDVVITETANGRKTKIRNGFVFLLSTISL
jgi:hypothetical protein